MIQSSSEGTQKTTLISSRKTVVSAATLKGQETLLLYGSLPTSTEISFIKIGLRSNLSHFCSKGKMHISSQTSLDRTAAGINKTEQ